MKQFDITMEQRLLELLKEELAIFEQMREHAKEQVSLLAADEMDKFFESLDTADKLKEKINGLHQEKDPLMQSYLSSSTASKKDSAKEINALGEKLNNIIRECADLIKEIVKSANTKKNEYTERIKELDTEKKTFNAYTMKIPDNSEHFDKST